MVFPEFLRRVLLSCVTDVSGTRCTEKGLGDVTFSELVRLVEQNGFTVVKRKGSIRYYGKPGWDKLIRVDYHGSKVVPTGTCQAILKAAGMGRAQGV